MRYSNLFFFSFLVLILFSFIQIGTADQIVLDKYGSPLVLNEQEIILKNDETGSISWDDFKESYKLRGRNGIWYIEKLEEKAKPKAIEEADNYEIIEINGKQYVIEKGIKPMSLEEYKESEEFKELKESFALSGIEKAKLKAFEEADNYEIIEINGKQYVIEKGIKPMSLEKYKESEEFKELFPLAQREKVEKEVEEFKAFKLDKDLSPISSDEMNKYIEKMLSPLILFLFGGIAILVLITYASNIYAGSLGMVIYLVIGVIMEIVPIWVLVLISLVGAGLVAYALSSGISGGGGE